MWHLHRTTSNPKKQNLKQIEQQVYITYYLLLLGNIFIKPENNKSQGIKAPTFHLFLTTLSI